MQYLYSTFQINCTSQRVKRTQSKTKTKKNVTDQNVRLKPIITGQRFA